MDKPSQLLIRAALHDTANALAGIQGILDLADPSRPLSARDRERLEAVLAEGQTTLVRTRHLAMDSLPERVAQEGPDWRAQLADELRPLSILFRCRFEFDPAPGAGPDLWPGTLLRSHLHAAARQVLPYLQGDLLRLEFRASHDELRITMRPITLMPEGLERVPEDKPGDVSARWAVRTAQALGLHYAWHAQVLTARLPRVQD